MKILKRIGVGILFVSLTLFGDVSGVFAEFPQAGEKKAQPPAALTQVKELRAVPQGEGILLRWRPVAACDGYRIYHEVSGKVRWDSLRSDVDWQSNPYLFLEVTRGEWYSFRVSALRNGQEGPLSAQVVVQMPVVTPPVLSDTGK